MSQMQRYVIIYKLYATNYSQNLLRKQIMRILFIQGDRKHDASRVTS